MLDFKTYWIRRDVLHVLIIWGRGNTRFNCSSHESQSFEINNKSYSVHILEFIQSNKDSIDKLYYNYNYGIMRYDYMDGEIWELILDN
jgi:hypothetical protein